MRELRPNERQAAARNLTDTAAQLLLAPEARDLPLEAAPAPVRSCIHPLLPAAARLGRESIGPKDPIATVFAFNPGD